MAGCRAVDCGYKDTVTAATEKSAALKNVSFSVDLQASEHYLDTQSTYATKLLRISADYERSLIKSLKAQGAQRRKHYVETTSEATMYQVYRLLQKTFDQLKILTHSNPVLPDTANTTCLTRRSKLFLYIGNFTATSSAAGDRPISGFQTERNSRSV